MCGGSASEPGAVRAIDVHAHLLPRAAIAAHERGEDWFGTRLEVRPRRLAAITHGRRAQLGSLDHLQPTQARLRQMDRRRVHVQVLSLLPPLFGYHLPPEVAAPRARAVNEELAGIVREYPGRFRGLATLPLQDTPAALAELEHATEVLGLDGIAVGTNVHGRDWDDPNLFPVLARAAELGALVFIHPMDVRVGKAVARYYLSNLLGNPFETTLAAAALIFGGVFDRVPDLKVCLAHGGGYSCMGVGRMDHGAVVRPEPRAAGVRGLPREYLQRMSFDTLTHSHHALRLVLEIVGSSQLVLGSDYPADMGEEDPVGFVEACAGLTDAERSAILHGNAARLLTRAAGAVRG